MDLGEQIVRWIASRVEAAGAKGVVLGLSGGLDSTVVARLCKRALKNQVLALIMPCQTTPQNLELARRAAHELDIPTEEVSLDEAYEKLLEVLPDASRLARANLKARLRMLTLYYFANQLGYLVAGTGNKSELMIGYFTKFGDGGADILPLGDLLKTEVRELARGLGISRAIIDRVPSAGLWEGQTDEGDIGLSYQELDRTLAAIEAGRTDEVPADTLARVREMMKASEHKRALPPMFRKHGAAGA